MLRISLFKLSLPKPIALSHPKVEQTAPDPDNGEPPVDALIDADGFHIVDRFGYYLTAKS